MEFCQDLSLWMDSTHFYIDYHFSSNKMYTINIIQALKMLIILLNQRYVNVRKKKDIIHKSKNLRIQFNIVGTYCFIKCTRLI